MEDSDVIFVGYKAGIKTNDDDVLPVNYFAPVTQRRLSPQNSQAKRQHDKNYNQAMGAPNFNDIQNAQLFNDPAGTHRDMNGYMQGNHFQQDLPWTFGLPRNINAIPQTVARPRKAEPDQRIPAAKPVPVSKTKAESQDGRSRKVQKVDVPKVDQVEPLGHDYHSLLELSDMGLVTNKEKFDCPICFCDIEVGEGVILKDCLHNYCRECLKGTVHHSETVLVKCPFVNGEYACDSFLQEREIKSLVSPEEYERHLARSLTQAEHQSQNSFHCKTPDCPGWCLFEGGTNEFFCQTCSRTNCLACAAIHEGQNCKQFQELLEFNNDTNKDVKKTREYLENQMKNNLAMKCPTCQVIVEKKGGCDMMTCTMCRNVFFWETKETRWMNRPIQNAQLFNYPAGTLGDMYGYMQGNHFQQDLPWTFGAASARTNVERGLPYRVPSLLTRLNDHMAPERNAAGASTYVEPVLPYRLPSFLHTRMNAYRAPERRAPATSVYAQPAVPSVMLPHWSFQIQRDPLGNINAIPPFVTKPGKAKPDQRIPAAKPVPVSKTKAKSQDGRSRKVQKVDQVKPLGHDYHSLLELSDMGLVTNKEKFDCPICFSDIEVGEGVILKDCLHNYCRECLRGTVHHSETVLVKCPFVNDEYACDSFLQEREIKSLVSPEEYERHLARSLAQAEHQSQNSFHCKTPDCPGWCLFEDYTNDFFCQTCSHTNCLACAAIHEGQNCKQFQELLEFNSDTNKDVKKTREYLENQMKNNLAMKCPTCQVIVEKTGGCNVMTCTMCRNVFFWETEQSRWFNRVSIPELELGLQRYELELQRYRLRVQMLH